MATHNFQVFDSNLSNMAKDESYQNDTTRLNGAQMNTPADPYSFNKSVHQATMMATALAQYMANNDVSCDDTNLTALVTAISQSLASAKEIVYADRMSHSLKGASDIGEISFCLPQLTPAVATYTASGNGNLLGGYHYREVLVTGYKNLDGTYTVCGFSPAATHGMIDVSPASQQVQITNLPIGNSGCIGRAIYRTAADGPAGTESYCGIVWDNTTTKYTDNLPDGQLGTGMPEVDGVAIPAAVPEGNSTGTYLDASQVAGGVTGATFGGQRVPKSGSVLQIPISLFNYDDARILSSANASNLKTVSVPGYYIIPDGSGFVDSPFRKYQYEGYHSFTMLVTPVDGTKVLQTVFSTYMAGFVKQRLVYSSTKASFWSPDTDNYDDGDQHYEVFMDGRQSQWGVCHSTITITVAYGTQFRYSDFQIHLPLQYLGYTPVSVSAYSPGELTVSGPNCPPQPGTYIQFDVLSPTAVKNLPVNFQYELRSRNVHMSY